MNNSSINAECPPLEGVGGGLLKEIAPMGANKTDDS